MTDVRNELPEQEPEEPIQDDAVIARAWRWSLGIIVLAGLAAAGVWWWQAARAPAPAQVQEAAPARPEVQAINAEALPPAVSFTDVTREAGIAFVHENGARGRRFLPETMGSGAAFFDYDNDGDQDLLLVNSDLWPEDQTPGAPRPTPALYANDGQGHFTDVTAATGLADPIYGMGVAVGDWDGDGWVDLFVSALGPDRLYRNDQGRFVDVTATAGVAGGPDDWSTAAAFFDADGDGDLDLFVAHYVRWSQAIDLEVDFQLTGIGRAYGPPSGYGGANPVLYLNQGDGMFADASAQAGIQVANPATGQPMGKGLALAVTDLDGDGRPDILVANDTVQNFAFRNLGGGRFAEAGMEWGLAFDRNGQATGAMGIDWAHHRNDDLVAVAIGNFANEMTSLYVCSSFSPGDPPQCSDDAILEGVGPASRLALSFGTLFMDYDLDGRPDLLQANGHLESEIARVQSSQQYAQPPLLFWNCGPDCPATFVAVSETGDMGRPLVGRGATYADIDGDGDLDLLITQNGRAPVLLRNDQALGHHWLRLRLRSPGPNRDAIGAKVEVRAG
jgi:enediyne biosynthesis protein E4